MGVGEIQIEFPIMAKKNIILEKTFSFSVKIIRQYQAIVNEKREYVLSKQLLRSGTSIGANVEEAIGGVSKKDFENKMDQHPKADHLLK